MYRYGLFKVIVTYFNISYHFLSSIFSLNKSVKRKLTSAVQRHLVRNDNDTVLVRCENKIKLIFLQKLCKKGRQNKIWNKIDRFFF